MIPYEVAVERIRTAIEPVAGCEKARVSEALRRVACESIRASHPNPAFDNSAVDGYLLGVSEAPEGSEFTISGEIRAGSSPPFSKPLEGEAVRIFTGAPVPWTGHSIVMQEDVEVSEGRWKIKEDARAGAHVRVAGSDFEKGTELIPPGARLGPVELAMASWCGLETIQVFRLPRVAVFVTGDELVNPGTPLSEGQIYDSNGPMLSSLSLSATPCETQAQRIGDTLDETKKAFESAAGGSDIILVSGGASVGDYDHVPAAVEQLGEVVFHGVSIKPGKPILFGRIGKSWIFGLPGNPASAFVCFEIFVREALRRLSGEREAKRLWLLARLVAPYQTGSRDEFVRVKLMRVRDELRAEPVFEQGSFGLRSLAGADGLARLEASRSYRPGDNVSIMILPHHL